MTAHLRIAVAAGGIAILGTSIARAQTSPYRVVELAPGIHAVTRQVPPGGVSDSNVLLIINDTDVVVVDANIFPSSARETIAEIRKLTANPVRYVINTHWHSDHHYGNQVYREAFPGVEFIQHPQTRAAVLERDVPALETNLKTQYPAAIARLRTELRTGRTSAGDSVTPEIRRRLETTLGVYELFLADMRSTPLVPGTLLVNDSLTLHRGSRTIVVTYLGRGNTAGDLVVHLPRERIVATGDLVVHPVPFAFFAHLGEWPNTLRALKRLDAVRILPGHGEVQSDWSYVDQLIALIESTWEQTRRAVEAGADLESALKAVNLDRFRQDFPGLTASSFDRLFLRPGVEAAYKDLKSAP
jgi:cyclase